MTGSPDPRLHLADRGRLALCALLLFAPWLRVGEEGATTLRRAQLLGQLITTRLAELLILRFVGRLDLLNDLLGDLRKLLVALLAGVTRKPGAIDRDHPAFTNPA